MLLRSTFFGKIADSAAAAGATSRYVDRTASGSAIHSAGFPPGTINPARIRQKADGPAAISALPTSLPTSRSPMLSGASIWRVKPDLSIGNWFIASGMSARTEDKQAYV